MYFRSLRVKRLWNWPQLWSLSIALATVCVRLILGMSAGRVPACFCRRQRAHPYCSETTLQSYNGFSHHFSIRKERLSLQRKSNLSQDLERHHSGSVILTPSGWKNALSLSNLVSFLDRIGSRQAWKNRKNYFVHKHLDFTISRTCLGDVIPSKSTGEPVWEFLSHPL